MKSVSVSANARLVNTCQLVAFKSLIARNKAEYMTSLTQAVKSDADADEDVKLKLPFILVNTSKETVIDCWLSSDRFSLSLSLSVCLSVCLCHSVAV